MKRIPQETKEAIVKKSLADKCVNLKLLAKQNNIGYSTLIKWRLEYKAGKFNNTQGDSRKNQLSQTERFQHILATAALDEHSLGVYCRERGLYAVQLTEWKNEMMTKNDDKKNSELLLEIKALREENKNLKQEVNRKDRALAETAALLVLKKKANSIWGDPEDV
jgi:transposase